MRIVLIYCQNHKILNFISKERNKKPKKKSNRRLSKQKNKTRRKELEHKKP